MRNMIQTSFRLQRDKLESNSSGHVTIYIMSCTNVLMKSKQFEISFIVHNYAKNTSSTLMRPLAKVHLDHRCN